MTLQPVLLFPTDDTMEAELELIQARIEQNRLLHPPTTRTMAPDDVQEYATRLHPQEIDTVEICPAYPDYMVIGTYALLKSDEKREHASQIRKGMLSIESVEMSSRFKPQYPGELRPALDKRHFSCAITDLHFHLLDDTLLGAATSDGSMSFFRVIKHADVIGRRVHYKLTGLGSVRIAPDDPHGTIPVITQFTWIPTYVVSGSRYGSSDKLVLTLAATTSDNEVKVVKVAIDNIRTLFDPRLAHQPEVLIYDSVDLHSHTLEAWCVAYTKLPTLSDHEKFAVFSGGDDSALSCNLLELETSHGSHFVDKVRFTVHSGNTPLLITPATHLWTDRTTHQAGVVAILPLSLINLTASRPVDIHNPSTDDVEPVPKPTIPLLTGSYDEYLRLYLINPTTCSRSLVLEHKLPGGGVWRVKCMDTYRVHNTTHFLILVSLMHGGVRIVRLTHEPTREQGWRIEVVAKFTKGHESMVYAGDFTKDNEGKGEYTVVSTSFYDMRICVWRFVDTVKAAMGE